MNGKEDNHLQLLDGQIRSNYEKKYAPGEGFGRYHNSLKGLIPIRKKKKNQGGIPTDSAGLFSLFTTSWLSKYMNKARKQGLKPEDLPKVSTYDSCNYNADRLELFWEEELSRRGRANVSFSRVAWRFCRTRVIMATIIQILSLSTVVVSYTLCMQKLLEFMQSDDGAYMEGMKWALLLAAATLARALLNTWAWTLNYITGMRLRSACLTLAYRRIIRLNNLGSKDIGAVINIFSNDAQRLFDIPNYGPLIVEVPMMTIYAVIYILHLFGPTGLAGMCVFLLFYLFQLKISRLVGYYQGRAVKISDMRVKLMNEILGSIKLIKMYAWEKRFSKELLGIRKTELRLIFKTLSYQISNSAMVPIIPMISASVTFLAHVFVGNNLTAAKVFPYSTFLSSRFRVALYLFQLGLENIVLTGVSINRITDLLLLEETECAILKPILKTQAVTITNGTFTDNTAKNDRKESALTNGEIIATRTGITSGEQSEEDKLHKPIDDGENVDVLFDVSFEVAKGKLVGICGQVGSGKTSLLLAALGQLRVSKGQVARDGSCAYVSQNAWIINATLRENILFGEEFDHDRYQQAIHTCNLIHDIDAMPGGDWTEIGEKGVNLSGGQKQRVALARALYADRDIYLLDDPLSAVDSRVGVYIFEKLILGALRGKTVLFVTHQIQYLNHCDDVYMMHNGRIIAHGTHDELSKRSNEYASMVAAVLESDEIGDETPEEERTGSLSVLTGTVPVQQKDHQISEATKEHAVETDEESQTLDAQLTVTEDIHQGSIRSQTYHSYISAAGGYPFMLVIIVIYSLSTGSTAWNSWLLATWIEARGGNTYIMRNNETILSDNMLDNPDFSYYQKIYAASIGAIIILTLLRSLIYIRATLGASTKLHNELFGKIISAPTRFFDTVPIGRIQHLFSRDMDEVDRKVGTTLDDWVQAIFKITINMFVICLVLPWFIGPFCIFVVAYYLFSRAYRVGIRDLKRMENQSRAAVISFITTSIQGLGTIHAFRKEDDFRNKFAEFSDENSKCLFLTNLAVMWLGLRLEVLSTAVIGCTACMIIPFKYQIGPAMAGLVLSYTMQIVGSLSFFIRIISDIEIQFTSVERINHYSGIVKAEGSTSEPTCEPPSNWPTAAVLKFSNVCMTYGEGAPLVLKNVSFTVDAGEKIGIVGRTGSGKSSLTVALFRLVEIAEGKIEIDDVDISEISLSHLRAKLSIIPQDPVLFSGTIRSNLDPFDIYTEVEIWKALEKIELKDRVRSINGQLDAPVGSGGDNWSVGERQLLCLARALLRNSKILVLDEATAAVDPETERTVHNTVQREFSNCTILIIAHRLQTVLSLSRVLVMNDGKLLEFDTPSQLLEDQNSEFSKMMAAANQAESQ